MQVGMNGDESTHEMKWTPACIHPIVKGRMFSALQVISHCENRTHPHPDSHRFEKISNIIKQFKLSCSKVSSNFTSMEVRNSMFAAYIDGFTTNTYVMVIMSDPSIREWYCTSALCYYCCFSFLCTWHNIYNTGFRQLAWREFNIPVSMSQLMICESMSCPMENLCCLSPEGSVFRNIKEH